MRTGIIVELSASDREHLAAIVADRNSQQKHVWRAHIVLLTADGSGTAEIMRRTGTSKTAVWRWQERFMTAGVAGLLRDKTRPSRIPPLGIEVVQRVVACTLADPPGETTHWTAGAMAKAIGISVSSVQRIWRKHGLQPHRMRQFKLSNDPKFASKLREIVGLYVDPPAHTVVLSIDEKSQIQALDRTQPGLPMKKGRCGTMTHDYKRHGTTTLFAALNVLNGKVIAFCDLKSGASNQAARKDSSFSSFGQPNPPFGICEGFCRQRLQRRAFDRLEQRAPAAADPAHGAGVQFVDQLADRGIELDDPLSVAKVFPVIGLDSNMRAPGQRLAGPVRRIAYG